MLANLTISVSKLSGVGPKLAKKLERLEIKTLQDLVYHFPGRFEDYSRISPIAKTKIGEQITIVASIWQIKNNFTRKGFTKTEAILADTTGTVEAIWFNQSWLTNTLTAGYKFQFSGKLTEYRGKPVLINPDFEEVGRNLHTARLVPVYGETDGVSSKWLRVKIAHLLDDAEFEEFLPTQILKSQKFLKIDQALRAIHFPKNFAEAAAAKERLAFDEVFETTMAVLSKKRKAKSETAIPLKIDKRLISNFAKSLPFKLTGAQVRAIKEVLQDLTKNYPAQRLIEGDVGCGKTVVVAAAVLAAVKNNTSAVIAAPTEILAFQHGENFKKMLQPFNVKVGIFTKSKKDRNCQVLIGTHALIQNQLPLKNVSLVVIDEQHRFGVSQRTKMAKTATGTKPHLITMSATPIPRSLALTVFGDLDLTVIDEMPAGRIPVKTYTVPPQKRGAAADFVKKEVEAGHQAFIICPLIEESETLTTVKAATVEFERLKETVFNKIPIDLLHGRMKSFDKEKVLARFAAGETKILVSTAVVEVGIDVPQATVMIIEGADRFGLAQLHQLRGRVGRAGEQAYCFLFSDTLTKNVKERLLALVRHTDGGKLAEIDLEIRGPGEFFGTVQHGFKKFKLAKLTDLALISKARGWAAKILAQDPRLEKFPKLAEIIKTSLSHEVTLS